MLTQICPTCGCSLVRLGIAKENIITRIYRNKEYSFCCEGCSTMFDSEPEKLLSETKDLVVCPSCLAEKPIEHTIALNHGKNIVHFCKCPYCMSIFKENAEYYMKRLSGEIEYSGVFSDGHGCCA